jgi:hypothetical protein
MHGHMNVQLIETHKPPATLKAVVRNLNNFQHDLMRSVEHIAVNNKMFTENQTEYFAHGNGRGRILYTNYLYTWKDLVNPQKSQTNIRCSNRLSNQQLARYT